jgi:hypothetical protein
VNINITYNQESDYIHATTSGILNGKSTISLVQKLMAAVSEHHCQRILHDLCNAKVDLETYEIYNIPELIKITGYSNTRRALVFASEAQDFSFFETVSKNQGQNVQVFSNLAEARHWLIS